VLLELITYELLMNSSNANVYDTSSVLPSTYIKNARYCCSQCKCVLGLGTLSIAVLLKIWVAAQTWVVSLASGLHFKDPFKVHLNFFFWRISYNVGTSETLCDWQRVWIAGFQQTL